MKSQNLQNQNHQQWQTIGRSDGIVEKRRNHESYAPSLAFYDLCPLCDERLLLTHQTLGPAAINEIAHCPQCQIQTRNETHSQH